MASRGKIAHLKIKAQSIYVKKNTNKKECVCECLVTQSRLTFVTPWNEARQTSVCVGFPRQEY